MPSGSNTNTAFSPGTIQAGLSALIEISVAGEKIGAIQELTTSEARGLERIQEVGTDGIIEVVPIEATKVDLRASRLVFERLRITEAFARAFQHIQAQTVPFRITVKQFNGRPGGAGGEENISTRTTYYENCWFTSMDSSYKSGAYLITENAQIWAERAVNASAFPDTPIFGSNTIHALAKDAASNYPQLDIEKAIDTGAISNGQGGLGGLDDSGTGTLLFP